MGWRGLLGFEYGIIQGPLGPDISGPELVAAVATAGAIGTLRVPDWESPDYVRELIHKTKTLTNKPFGVGVVLAFPHKENIKVILEEKVAILLVSWGDYPTELVSEAHDAGVKVIHQVGCVEDASKAIDAGVDAIIFQSHDAGGHVLGQLFKRKRVVTPQVPETVQDAVEERLLKERGEHERYVNTQKKVVQTLKSSLERLIATTPKRIEAGLIKEGVIEEYMNNDEYQFQMRDFGKYGFELLKRHAKEATTIPGDSGHSPI